MTPTRYQVLTEGGVFDFETRSIVRPRSGSGWEDYQTWLSAGNTPLPPDSAGLLDLVEAKRQRNFEINAYAAGLRNKAVQGRSSGEMASWAIKLNEARNFQASADPLQAPTLDAIAQIRGITIGALAQKVIDQATPFLQAEAYIDGVRGKHCDTVEALETIQDLLAYDWHSGWPSIPNPFGIPA